ncbi:MAG: FHIPEP family type III secretion protein [Enterobacter hormaechei]
MLEFSAFPAMLFNALRGAKRRLNARYLMYYHNGADAAAKDRRSPLLVGGNFVIGNTVFIILIIINFIISPGAGRRSAAVTFDGMPGANGNRPERRPPAREANAAEKSDSGRRFYGSMDGASKFCVAMPSQARDHGNKHYRWPDYRQCSMMTLSAAEKPTRC